MGRFSNTALFVLLFGGAWKGHVQATLELACDYLNAGLKEEAVAVLRTQADSTFPIVHYLLGYLTGEPHRGGHQRFLKA